MLPDEKSAPTFDPLNKKSIVYGPPKIGKSTLVSKLYPNALYIASDPTGLEELEVYKADCRDWATFRRIGQELAMLIGNHDHPYDAVCVDTVDELVRFCRQDVLAGLSGGPVNKKPDDFLHESDWDYGKAWNAVTEEFRIRIAKLCNLGLPVVFISHSKEKVQKDRTGLEITINSPDIGSGQAREWLLKFVDYIFFAEMVGDEQGEHRLLHTMPSERWLAGARQPEGKPLLPEPLPLDGARLRAALLATAPGANPKMADGDSSRTSQEPERSSGVDIGHEPPKTNGKAKAEPKKVQDAREVIASIDERVAAEDGYSEKEAAALRVVAEYEAKQKGAVTV